MTLDRSKWIVLLLMVLPAVYSCTAARQWVSSKEFIKKRTTSEDPGKQSTQAARQAERHMAAGEYQKALAIYNAAHQKHPKDQALVKVYRTSLERMAASAEKALSRQDFAEAGKTYDLLLKNYARFKAFNKDLSFNREMLVTKRDECKKALYKQGFQEYRQGNLSKAIAMWQAFLVIDPENTDIQEALKTAKLQQKNLSSQE